MNILLNIVLTLLTYGVLTNLVLLLVKFDYGKKIYLFLAHTCGLSYVFAWILGMLYLIIKIWK